MKLPVEAAAAYQPIGVFVYLPVPIPLSSLADPLLPFTLPGTAIDAIRTMDATMLVEAHTSDPCQHCPACGQPSTRVHSRSVRRLRDLPVAGRSVHVLLRVRRFWCAEPTCPQRTFAERLLDLAPLRAWRTPRLTQALYAIGRVAGGEAGARLATSLNMATSGDTLLRLLRAAPSPEDGSPPPTVIGIDDFDTTQDPNRGRSLAPVDIDDWPIELALFVGRSWGRGRVLPKPDQFAGAAHCLRR